MIKRIMLSVCLLLSQVLAINVAQAQSYPGFTSFNEFLTDTLKCDGNKVICLPSLQEKKNIYYIEYGCFTGPTMACIDPNNTKIYGGSTVELYALMQNKVAQYNQAHPGTNLTVSGPTTEDQGGSYTYTIGPYTEGSNPYAGLWTISRYDVYCDYADALGCMNSNTDRTSMTDAPCEICSKIGNPFDVRNGAKYEYATDMAFPFAVTRNYSSKQRIAGLLGKNWRTNFDKSMKYFTNNNIVTSLVFTTPTSEYITMISNDGINFTAFFRDQKKYKVKVNGNVIQLIRPDSGIETYDMTTGRITTEVFKGQTFNYVYYNNGLLNKVSDIFGRYVQFNYNTNSFVSQIISYNGDTVSYTYYDSNIATVKYNNIPQISYEYGINGLLTAKLDPNGVKFASFSYDEKGRGIENKHMTNDGHDIKKYTVSYTDNTTHVSQDNGYVADYTMNNINYAKKITNMTGNGVSEDANFDQNGNGMFKKSQNGVIENYNYDPDGRMTFYMKDAKQVNINWNTDYNFIDQTIENTGAGNRTTQYYQDANGNDLGYRIVGNNVEAYVYKYRDSYGRLTSEQNEQGFVKTYTYYPISSDLTTSGFLKSVTTNTGSQLVINSYDIRNNPTSITVNGVTKTITYDYKGRILTESVNGATNSYTYDLDGNLTNSTMASGYQLNMHYDTAGRLLSIDDNMGGKSVFTPDDYTGEVLKSDILQNNVLVRSRNKIVDTLGRTLEAYNATIRTKQSINYSSRSDLPDSTTDANGISSNYSYNMPGQITSYSSGSDSVSKNYDVEGKLRSVSANNQTTNMDYDDLGRIVSINSPDTGTSSFTYDKSQDTYTDANGTLHTTYKGVGGLPVNVTHINNDSNFNYSNFETYEYDTYGRVTRIQSQYGEVTYTRNNLGQLTKKSQNNMFTGYVPFVVQYGYDNIGQKTTDTYPSGTVVTYEYTNGFVTGLRVNGTSIVSNVTYNTMLQEPVSWYLGGRSVVVTKDTDGLLTNFSETGIFNQQITTDNEGHILTLTDNLRNTNINVLLDDNYALKSGTMNNNVLDYTFGDNHNLTKQIDGITNYMFEYDYSSNKLSYLEYPNVQSDKFNYRHDANGNLLTDRKATYQYDGHNNLEYSYNKVMVYNYEDTVMTRYFYNGLNQRIGKQVNTQGGQKRNFVYNENNQLIAEYDSDNNLITEYFYFGLRPVAVKTNGVLYAVHTDYLGTPRVITGLNGGSVVWEWKNDNPYGNNKAQGSIEFNLRFAGQYYDSESGLHYNMNRTYNPETGRYLQSDPLGLAAGFNTYNYVNKNPLDGVDPLGLVEVVYNLKHGAGYKMAKQSGQMFGWVGEQISNYTFMALETAVKLNRSSSDNDLIIDAHGSEYTLSGFSATQLGDQIISGKFKNPERTTSSYFADRIKKNLDINITLNACDTGSLIVGPGFTYSYADDLAMYLKAAAGSNYTGKINISAPTGLTTYIVGWGEIVKPDPTLEGPLLNTYNRYQNYNGYMKYTR